MKFFQTYFLCLVLKICTKSFNKIFFSSSKAVQYFSNKFIGRCGKYFFVFHPAFESNYTIDQVKFQSPRKCTGKKNTDSSH